MGLTDQRRAKLLIAATAAGSMMVALSLALGAKTPWKQVRCSPLGGTSATKRFTSLSNSSSGHISSMLALRGRMLPQSVIQEWRLCLHLAQLIALGALSANNAWAKGNGQCFFELEKSMTVDGVTLAAGPAIAECSGGRTPCDLSEWKASAERPMTRSGECPARQVGASDEDLKRTIEEGRLASSARFFGLEIPAGSIVRRAPTGANGRPWMVVSLSEEVIADGCHLARESSVMGYDEAIQLAAPCSVGGVPMAAGQVQVRPGPGKKLLPIKHSVVLGGVLHAESRLRFSGAIQWPAGTSFSTSEDELRACPSQPTPVKAGVILAPALGSLCTTFDSAGRLREAYFSQPATFRGVAFTSVTLDQRGRPINGYLTAQGAKVGRVVLEPDSFVAFFPNGAVSGGSLGQEYDFRGTKIPSGIEVEFRPDGSLARLSAPSRDGHRESVSFRGWKVWEAEFDAGILQTVALSDATEHLIDGYPVEGRCRFYPDGRLESALVSKPIRIGQHEVMPGQVRFGERGQLRYFKTAVPFTTSYGRTYAAGEYVHLL